MHVVLFEDFDYLNFKPFSNFHVTFDNYYGYRKIYQKVFDLKKHYQINKISFLGREKQLNSFLSENNLDNPMFNYSKDLLFINSRIANINKSFELNTGEFLVDDNNVLMGLRIDNFANTKIEIPEFFNSDLNLTSFKMKEKVKSLKYSFDFIKNINDEFFRDFDRNEIYIKKNMREIQKNVFIGENVKISKFVEFDTSNGPIIINSNTKINAFTSVFGPVYIGENCEIDKCYIRENSIIGNTCKVSGEIEESYISDYSNKHHTGFLGHSYVGEWVNIGAMTTTSDLKNNYGNIKFLLNNKLIDSYSNKMGSLFGDHVKLAIGVMVNCGSIINPCSVIFDTFSEKTILPVQWGNKGIYEEEKLILTSKKIAKRRNKEFSENYLRLFHEFFLNI